MIRISIKLNKASVGITTYESLSGSVTNVPPGYTADAVIYTEGITSLRVKTTDGTNIVYSNTYEAKIDRTPPTINAANRWGSGADVGGPGWWTWYVHSDYTDSGSGIAYRYIQWNTELSSGLSQENYGYVAGDNVGTSGGGKIDIYIKVRDAAGNEAIYGWATHRP